MKMTKPMNLNDYTPSPGEPEEFVQQRRNALPTPAKEKAEERLAPATGSACLGVLMRDEFPCYFNGFGSVGGASWISNRGSAMRIEAGEIETMIEKIAASPYLRTMAGLKWEYLPNDELRDRHLKQTPPEKENDQ